MLNQRKLQTSILVSFMLIMVITIVKAEDTENYQETAVQNTESVAFCIEELPEEIAPLCNMALPEEKNETDGDEEKRQEEKEEVSPTPEPEKQTGEATPEGKKKYAVVETEQFWNACYTELWHGTQTEEILEAREAIEERQYELSLMSCETDHIVNYHGTKYAISDEEYRVLLRIVEAEAPEEDAYGKMLVANVVLNRVHAEQFPDTISEVVFQKDQFAPVRSGSYYRRTVSEETVEAVERVLAGEDHSQGALYFVARALASKEGLRFFDEKLEKLFKHGVHTFYAEK